MLEAVRPSSIWTTIAFVLALWPSLGRSKSFSELDKDYEKVYGGERPGFALRIYRAGKLLHESSMGYADLSLKKPNQASTNFNLASVSKQFVAALALIMEHEGILKANDPVSKFIPEFKGAKGTITLRDLIHHRSGLPDYMELCKGTDKVTNQSIIRFLAASERLEFNPGSKFEYSNSGYVVLSELIQRASKKNFRDYMQEKIFRPLKMLRSEVRDEKTLPQIDARAVGYSTKGKIHKFDDTVCDHNYGDGGIYTSQEDYKKWLDALLAPNAFFSVQQQRQLFSDPFDTKKSADDAYGYGWFLQKSDGHPLYIHSGGWDGFRSIVALYPTKELALVAFSNAMQFSPKDIVNSYLGAALD